MGLGTLPPLLAKTNYCANVFVAKRHNLMSHLYSFRGLYCNAYMNLQS